MSRSETLDTLYTMRAPQANTSLFQFDHSDGTTTMDSWSSTHQQGIDLQSIGSWVPTISTAPLGADIGVASSAIDLFALNVCYPSLLEIDELASSPMPDRVADQNVDSTASYFAETGENVANEYERQHRRCLCGQEACDVLVLLMEVTELAQLGSDNITKD